MENGNREPSVKKLQMLAKLFSMTTDQILNYEGDIPQEVSIEDKKEFERVKLINQLDKEDKQTVFMIIDTMLAKQKFKDFFNKNVVTLWAF